MHFARIPGFGRAVILAVRAAPDCLHIHGLLRRAVILKPIVFVEVPLHLLPLIHDLFEIELSGDLFLRLRVFLYDHRVLSVSLLAQVRVIVFQVPESPGDRLLHPLLRKYRFFHRTDLEGAVLKHRVIRCRCRRRVPVRFLRSARVALRLLVLTLPAFLRRFLLQFPGADPVILIFPGDLRDLRFPVERGDHFLFLCGFIRTFLRLPGCSFFLLFRSF